MIRKGLVIMAAASLAILAISTLTVGCASHGLVALVVTRQPPPPVARPGIIGAGLNIRLTPAQATVAARHCSGWASKAGFANNGPSGDLAVAVAIGMAESGCDALACYDDTTGTECSASAAAGSSDSIDRGVWQINSHYWKDVTNRCAFSGLCNALSSYNQVSGNGTNFTPWTTYLAGTYKRYLAAAQAAVSALRAGTVTSADIGWCASYGSDRRGADVRVAHCGIGDIRAQWWTITSGGWLRTTGGLCLSAPSGDSVTVQRCSSQLRQHWQARSGSTLYNEGARSCLTAPGGTLTSGRVLTLSPCRQRRPRPGTSRRRGSTRARQSRQNERGHFGSSAAA